MPDLEPTPNGLNSETTTFINTTVNAFRARLWEQWTALQVRAAIIDSFESIEGLSYYDSLSANLEQERGTSEKLKMKAQAATQFFDELPNYFKRRQIMPLPNFLARELFIPAIEAAGGVDAFVYDLSFEDPTMNTRIGTRSIVAPGDQLRLVQYYGEEIEQGDIVPTELPTRYYLEFVG